MKKLLLSSLTFIVIVLVTSCAASYCPAYSEKTPTTECTDLCTTECTTSQCTSDNTLN